MTMGTIELLGAFILSLGGIGAGLSALNLNLLSILKLNSLGLVLKYTCGLAGLFGAYKVVTTYNVMVEETSSVGIAMTVILIITNVGIGMSGLGTNIARALHMEYLQKSLQLIAGAAGAYTFFILLQMVK